jgi:hypothetical protein
LFVRTGDMDESRTSSDKPSWWRRNRGL